MTTTNKNDITPIPIHQAHTTPCKHTYVTHIHKAYHAFKHALPTHYTCLHVFAKQNPDTATTIQVQFILFDHDTHKTTLHHVLHVTDMDYQDIQQRIHPTTRIAINTI